MLPSWFRQTVTRIRPGIKESRGSVIPDWENVERLTISGCSVQPSSTSLDQDGRVLGISDSFTLYMPYNADVVEGDHIEYEGEEYTVMGVLRPWLSPTGNVSNKQVTIERWDG